VRPFSTPDAASSSDPVQIPNTKLCPLGLAPRLGDPNGVEHRAVDPAAARRHEQI
jgi:hypothetical protein